MDDRSFEINEIDFLLEQQEDLSIWLINQETGDLELIFELVSFMSGTSYSVRDTTGIIGTLDKEEHGWVFYRRPLQTRIPLLVDDLPSAFEAVARHELGNHAG